MQRAWLWPFVIGVVFGGGLSFFAADLVVNAGASYLARLPHPIPRQHVMPIIAQAAPPPAPRPAVQPAPQLASMVPIAAPQIDVEPASVDTSMLGPASNGWLTGNDRQASTTH